MAGLKCVKLKPLCFPLNGNDDTNKQLILFQGAQEDDIWHSNFTPEDIHKKIVNGKLSQIQNVCPPQLTDVCTAFADLQVTGGAGGQGGAGEVGAVF